MYEVKEICRNGESLPLTTDGNLRVVFIGTGSAFAKRRRQSNILIIQGKHHVLIDCGTQGPLALNDLGLSVLDVRCYLPTHSHADHIGGLVSLVESIPTDTLLDTYSGYGSWTYNHLIERYSDLGTVIKNPKAGETLNISPMESIQYFAPDSIFFC